MREGDSVSMEKQKEGSQVLDGEVQDGTAPLWDDEQPPVVPPGSIQIPDIGGTLEREKGWADG